MKIQLDQACQNLRYASAVIIVSEGNRPVVKPYTDFYADQPYFLSLNWVDDDGEEITLNFSRNQNQEIEFDERFGVMTLNDQNANIVELRLLETVHPHFDEILEDLPLDRLIHKDNIERFYPYDRLGYNYQQWLHKHRAKLIEVSARFKVPLKDDKKKPEGEIVAVAMERQEPEPPEPLF